MSLDLCFVQIFQIWGWNTSAPTNGSPAPPLLVLALRLTIQSAIFLLSFTSIYLITWDLLCLLSNNWSFLPKSLSDFHLADGAFMFLAERANKNMRNICIVLKCGVPRVITKRPLETWPRRKENLRNCLGRRVIWRMFIWISTISLPPDLFTFC